MPMTCLVVGCGSRYNRDHISFYCVPAVLNHKFLIHLNDLSKKRRERWLAALKRDNAKESILKNQRVCSKHFITGKPASLDDENHPDWVPSKNMRHTSPAVRKRKSNVGRQQTARKRLSARPLKREQAREPLEKDLQGEEHEDQATGTSNEEQATGTSTQTDLTMEELNLKLNQLSNASKEIEDLKKQLKQARLGCWKIRKIPRSVTTKKS